MSDKPVLYDAFGRKVETPARPESRDMRSTVNIDRSYRYPSAGITPRKMLSLLRAADMGDVAAFMELAAEMEEKDGHLGSLLEGRRLAVAGLEWTIEPFSPAQKDVEIADACREAVDRLTRFEQYLLTLCDAIGKGFSALEIGWGVRGGKNVIDWLRETDQRRFLFIQGDDKPRLLTEANMAMGEELPPWKFICHIHKLKNGSLLRQGAVRRITWLWLFKHYALKDWAAYAELFGIPLRVGKYGPSASDEDKSSLARALQLLGSDAAAIMPEGMNVEFVNSESKNGEGLFKAFADFINAEMSKAVLGHGAAVDSTPGKLGNERDSDKSADNLLRFDAELIGGTIRDQLFRPFVGFNFGWDAAVPWFRLKWQPEEDRSAKLDSLRKLYDMGAPVPLDDLYAAAGIEAPEDGEAVAMLPAVSAAPAIPAADAALNAARSGCPCGAPALNASVRAVGAGFPLKGTSAADGARLAPQAAPPHSGSAAPLKPAPTNDAADFISHNLLAKTDMASQLDAIKKLMAECATIEEFRDRLLEAYGAMDTAGLADLMAQALAVADLAGRFTAGGGAISPNGEIG